MWDKVAKWLLEASRFEPTGHLGRTRFFSSKE